MSNSAPQAEYCKSEDSQLGLVVIHGLGDDQGTATRVAHRLDPLRRTDWIIPRAPSERGRGYAWFPFGLDESAEIFWRSVNVLESQVVRAAEALDRDPSTLIFAGFSQGGAVAVASAYRDSPTIARPAAVVSFSGFFPEFAAPDIVADLSLPPALVVHGTLDYMMPVRQGHLLCERLRAAGVEVEWRQFEGAHRVPPNAGAWLAHWLSYSCGLSGALD